MLPRRFDSETWRLTSFATTNQAGTAASSGATVAYNYGFSQSDLNRITNASVGTVALAAGISDNNNLDFTSYAGLTLGASGATAATYAGTLTPNGTTYRLGGGTGTLSFNSAIASGNLLVGLPGNTGSTGTFVLGGANTFSGGITINSGNTVVGNVASTSPFGASNNALVLNNGTLVLNPDAANNLSQSIGAVTSNGVQSVLKINSDSAGSVVTTLNIDSVSLPGIVTQNSTAIATGASGAIFFNSGSTSSLTRSVFNFTGTLPAATNACCRRT